MSPASGTTHARTPGLAPEPRVLVPLRIDGEPPALGQLLHALDGETMGTTWSVRFIGPSGLRLAAIEAAIVGACDEVIAQMSGWDAASDLSRFNRAPAGTVCPLPDDFATVLDAARWTLSFGRLTLSHELARVVLYEQLYRVLTIEAGMSYHREP